MEKVTETKNNIFKNIKNAIKVIFTSKEEVTNSMEDIMDWDECIEKINSDTFSESDRKIINNILESEKSLEKAKNKVQEKGIRKNLKETIKNKEVKDKEIKLSIKDKEKE